LGQTLRGQECPRYRFRWEQVAGEEKAFAEVAGDDLFGPADGG
jgi:hypothetical protein